MNYWTDIPERGLLLITVFTYYSMGKEVNKLTFANVYRACFFDESRKEVEDKDLILTRKFSVLEHEFQFF